MFLTGEFRIFRPLGTSKAHTGLLSYNCICKLNAHLHSCIFANNHLKASQSIPFILCCLCQPSFHHQLQLTSVPVHMCV